MAGSADARVSGCFRASDVRVAALQELHAPGYHAYTVSVAETQDGRQAFAACAESDLDGDGAYAAWMIWLPVEDDEGDLIAPSSPCRFNPLLAREAVFGEGDEPGVPVRVSPAEVF